MADVSQPDQPLVFVNHGFLKLSGYALDDVIGRNCRFLQAPKGAYLDADALADATEARREADGDAAETIRAAIDARENIDGLVIRNYAADGHAFWNELFLTPVDDGEGVTHYVGVQNDVTDRVEAQRSVRRQASQLKDIIDAMPIPIGLLEMQDGGRIRHVLANATASDAFDLDPETEVGLDGLGFRGQARSVWVDAVRRAEATGAPVRFEAPRVADETYEVTVSPVRDRPESHQPASPTRFFYLARNITDGIQLEKDVLQISARELSRVARDIHDGVGQTLVGASLLSSALAADLREAPQSTDAERLEALVRASLGQLRQFALGLDPVDIEDLGVVAALGRLTTDVSVLFGIDVVLTAEPCPVELARDAALDVYRIAQEAITNAVRHGHAEHITVDFACDARGFHLTITDDGVGISADAIDGPDGMGLRTMRGRARRLGGPLEVLNNPRGGTIVRVHATRAVPLD